MTTGAITSRVQTSPQTAISGSRDPNLRFSWIVFAIVIAAASTYAYLQLMNGWIAADDGYLAQSALRVLRGELPHRDFRENYTAGLSFYHALAFRIFGVKLVALRYAVFALFVPCIAAIYYIASRFASARAAGAITLLAVAWNLPTYPAAMPSWYNLFLAIIGTAAILRFVDAGRRRWLILAGVCAGASCAVKVVGFYFVAAILLFFIFREQSAASARPDTGSRSLAYSFFLTFGLVFFLGLLVWMMRQRLGGGELYHFVLPAAAVVALLLWRESRIRLVASRERFRELLRLSLPFLLGFAIPLVLLLVPYVKAHSVTSLAAGVVTGVTNAISAPRRPVGPDGLLYIWPLYAAMAVALRRKRSWSMAVYVLSAAGLAALLGFARSNFMIGFLAWRSAVMADTAVILLGVWFLVQYREFATALSQQAEQGVFLLIAVAALCNLVQFPFALPIYLCYVAPLLALALFSVVSVSDRCRCQPFFALLLAFYLGFGLLFVVPRAVYLSAFTYDPPTHPLHVARAAGLQVLDAANYDRTAEAVVRVARNGPILAFPECPEIYFLTGLQNPTRDDLHITSRDFERGLQDARIKVMVLNHGYHVPAAGVSPQMLSEITSRFPYTTTIGRYEIRWRP